MNAILHIGLPKTGTTSIQRWLYANRKSLLDVGYHVPEAGLRNDLLGGHFRIFQAAKGRECLSSLVREIASEAIAGKVVVSCEALCHLNRSQIERLHEEFDGPVVIYLRNVYDHFESWYKSQMRLGEMVFRKRVQAEKYSQTFTFDKMLMDWADVFGDVKVRVYDRCRSNVVEDFAQLLPGVNVETMQVPGRFWESMPNEAAESLARLDQTFGSWFGGSRLYRRACRAIIRQTNPGKAMQWCANKLPSPTMEEDWQEILTPAVEAIAALTGRWLGQQEVALLTKRRDSS